MMRNGLWISLCLVCAAAIADSGEERIGDTTHRWLELQKSQNQGSNHQRPLPGPVAQRSYQRYLRSFEREIPVQFERGGSRR